MHQLSGLDATFLYGETRTVVGHVSGLLVYDPSTRPGGVMTLDAVKQLLLDRIHAVPAFRWRLVQVPFDLDHPYWVDDPDFDIDYHVREIALAPPGRRGQLAEQVARIVSRPLDRARPLWELYLIHGLENGRAATLTKMHHAAIDGVSGTEILGTLLDLTPEPREIPPPERPYEAEPVPGTIGMLGRGLYGVARHPLRALERAPRTVPNLLRVPGTPTVPGTDLLARAAARARQALPGAGEDGQILERPAGNAPRTPLNGRLSPHRRVAFGSFPLSDVKEVKNAFGFTVNDVVVAMCTGALRAWLERRDALPGEPLLAMVPVSVRTDEQQNALGNQVSMMVVPIPTHLDEPAARLRAVHQAMRVAKERHRAIPATLLQDVTEFVPPAVFARAARALGRIGAADVLAPPFNVIISNVPGPQFPLYSGGARLEANYPISAIMEGVGLNMTVISYDGHLDFGLVGDRDRVPDIWDLLDGIGDELARLGGAARRG